ncbi:MAG TPA: hypothetical protein VKH43_14825 [Thermoanaerobaculia bacterium]|nr:hypothetical protein [Thermoanaerobaculia bacterium]
MRARGSPAGWVGRWTAILLLLAPGTLLASRLPIKTYTTADGLARDFVTCIEQDPAVPIQDTAAFASCP